MKATVFGTCRQESIKNNISTSTIQENLTYPYNTRELIQAIRFCKNESCIPKEYTKFCFRSGILKNSTLNQEEFINEYSSSDFFLLEIPSRSYHTYNNYVVHQILDISGVTKHILSDEEVENDIITIKELLHPKPFIIVSHIYTYKHGERYSFVKLLEKLTKKYSIPFINPMDTLEKYVFDHVFVNEKKISHYTDYGHKIMKEVYLNEIDKILKNK